MNFKVADLVEERSNDTIGFFDESKGKFEEDWIKKIWDIFGLKTRL